MTWSDYLPVAGEGPEFVAGLVMVVLAVGVLYVRFSDSLNRAFALYLVVGGVEHVWAALDDTPAIAELAGANLGYYRVASLFALIYLGLRYRSRQTDRELSLWVPGLLLAGTLAGGAAWFLRPGAISPIDTANDALAAIAFLYGWGLRLAVSGAFALAFAREALRSSGNRRTGSLLGSAAFGLEPAFIGGFVIMPVLRGDIPDLLLEGDDIGFIVGGLIALAAAGLLARALLRDAVDRPTPVRWTTAAFLVAGGTGIILAVISLAMGGLPFDFDYVWGVFQLALPVLLAYAILRHQVFDLEVKVRWGVSKTTVAGIFVAVFFIAGELAETFFGDVFGDYVGVIAAGMLVFAISPLQRVADRFAERAVPGGNGPSPAEQRYRTAVEMALMDGEVTEDEERRLAELVEELGLSPTRAFEVRREVEAERRGAD